MSTRIKKVSFWTQKEIKKPVRVSFWKSTGERVSFTATKKILKPKKVTFYVKERR